MGKFQGNGAVPTGWVIVINFILCYLCSKQHIICIWCAISDLILTWLDILFVDDGDIPIITNKKAETCDIVMAHHQDKLVFWDGDL